jgi:sirohydrochlorin cobaltochelatase
MSHDTAVILFAHGAREAEWALPFERLRERLRASGTKVEIAYLSSMRPPLEEAVAVLARQGATRVTIVPMFLAQGGHLKEDLPRMVADIRAMHPEVELAVTPALGEDDGMLDAMAAWVRRAAGQKGEAGR